MKTSLRQLRKNPGMTAVIVLSLAVGIGPNAVVFSWIRATLLDSIPGAADPGRLAVISPQHKTGAINDTMSLSDIQSLAAETNIFAGVTASQFGPVALKLGEKPEWFWGQHTLANFFDVLGVRPVVGRGFLPGEDRPGAQHHVAVISHALWQQRFGGTADVLGRVIELNERPVTIVGVAPAAFPGAMGGLRMDLWVPLATQIKDQDLTPRYTSRGWRWLHTVARLQDGVSFSRADAAADAVGQRLAQEFPNASKDSTFRVLRLWDATWGGQSLFLPLLKVLAIVAGLLLLLVAANVANLLLSHAQARQRELGVRLALGASAGRLIRQLLGESLWLAVLGGLSGVALAVVGVNFLFSLLPPTYLPIGYDLRLNGSVLAAIAALTLATGLLFGLAPALQAARTNLNEALKAGGRGAAGHSPRYWLRRGLVVGEVALALTLLIGMGLCVRSFAKAQQIDLGLDPRNVWLAGFRISPHAGDDASARQFYRRLREEAAQLPGVERAALASWLPLGFEGGETSGVSVPGYTPAPGESMSSGVSMVSPGYFETLKIPIVSGREFSLNDEAKEAAVAIVNQAFAQKYFPGLDPVGRSFNTWRGDLRIVGVVPTAKYRELNEPARPFFYVSTEQFGARDLTLVARTSGAPQHVARAVEQLGLSLSPYGRPTAALPFEEFIRAAFTIPRVAATLLAALGMLALMLAMLGIYAVISQSVGQRVRELGVRLALGAQPRDLRALILGQGLRLAILGVVLGAVAAAGVSRLLANLLVGVSTADLVTWSLVPVVLVAAAAAACWLPARRASRVDPMIALRNDG